MGILFTTMLGADPAPAAAIYDSIRSDNGRRDAFRAIADQSITSEIDRAILDFILERAKKTGQARDTIAHSLWATQSDLPDALLLLDPKIMPMTHVGFSVAKAGETDKEKHQEIVRLMQEMRKATTVWKELDFLEARQRISKLLFLATTFPIVLSHSSGSAEQDKARKIMLDANSELSAFVVKRTNKSASDEATDSPPQAKT